MADSQRKQYPTRAVTNKHFNVSLTTTSATADQSIGSYTPDAGVKLCLQVIIIEVYYTTLDTTAALLGAIKLIFGTDTILGPFQASNTSSGALFGIVIPLPEEYVLEGDGSKVLEAFCSPALATSIVWKMTLLGYERS